MQIKLCLNLTCLISAANSAPFYSHFSMVENTMMQEEPMVTQYPAYEGDGMITVNRTTVIDPDGNIVEINQILDGLDLDTEGF